MTGPPLKFPPIPVRFQSEAVPEELIPWKNAVSQRPQGSSFFARLLVAGIFILVLYRDYLSLRRTYLIVRR